MLRKAINNQILKKSNKYASISNIKINNEDTHIPINLPSAIIADKGSGKTTLLKTIMYESFKNKQFNHIYFIFSSLTWDEELPSYIIKINIDISESFLSKYFNIKSLFISYSNFINKLANLDSSRLDFIQSLKSFLEAIDNNISKEFNSEITFLSDLSMKYTKDIKIEELNKTEEIINKIINNANKFINTYSKEFYIDNIKVDKINKNDRDLIVIDDIAIASKILFKQMKESSIYKYLTLTRHMRLCILFSGQQVDQIPKFIRREIMTWIFSKNTSIELLEGILNKSIINKINENKNKLNRYEFLLYNCIEDYYYKI